jgi:glycine betaine/proline transport system substrate-binding protein
MVAVGVVSSAALLIAACSSDGGASPAPTDTENPGSSESKIIKLAQNPWDSSRLNVAVAKIILTEKMGYEVSVTEGQQDDQWESLVKGDLQVNLEVWPLVHADKVAEYVTSAKVENGGELGPVGKIGWYIPTYVLTQHPELQSWEGLKDPKNIALFSSPTTGAKGRFLSGDTSWGTHDAEIIKNLGLDLEVVYAGSEQAELDEIDSLYNKRAPILFYLWVPHYAFAKYDLTAMMLPAHSDACYSKAASGGIDCDYPAERLLKVFAPSFKDKSPIAHEFFKRFQYTTKDQINMIGKVNNEHMSIEAAARAWIDANPTVWQAWIP